jgi:hypothetical protein
MTPAPWGTRKAALCGSRAAGVGWTLVFALHAAACGNAPVDGCRPTADRAEFTAEIDGRRIGDNGELVSSASLEPGQGDLTLTGGAAVVAVKIDGCIHSDGEGVWVNLLLDPYEILRAGPGTVHAIRGSVHVTQLSSDPIRTHQEFSPEEGHSPAILVASLRGGGGGTGVLDQRISGELRVDDASLAQVRGRMSLRSEIIDDPFASAGDAKSISLEGDFEARAYLGYQIDGTLVVSHEGERFEVSAPFNGGGFADIRGYARVNGAKEPDGSIWIKLTVPLPARADELKRGKYALAPSANHPTRLLVLRGREEITPEEQEWRGELEVVRNTGSRLDMRGALTLEGFGEVRFETNTPYEPEAL